jgi:uncharacterized membrane protein YgcG
MKPLAWWTAGWLVAAAPAAALPPDRIADPRPKSAVVDTTSTLQAADVAAIDALAARSSSGRGSSGSW